MGAQRAKTGNKGEEEEDMRWKQDMRWKEDMRVLARLSPPQCLPSIITCRAAILPFVLLSKQAH